MPNIAAMGTYANQINLRAAAAFAVPALILFACYRMPIATAETDAVFISAGRDVWSKSGGLTVEARLPGGEQVTARARPNWRPPDSGALIRLENQTTLFGFHVYEIAQAR